MGCLGSRVLQTANYGAGVSPADAWMKLGAAVEEEEEEEEKEAAAVPQIVTV
jgi:hypothetical protein